MQNIAKMVLQLSNSELLLEQQRMKLAEHTMFEPYTLFLKLDSSNRGLLNCQQLTDYLLLYDLLCDREEFAYLFKKIDSDRDGRISYTDFYNYVLPKLDENLRNQLLSKDCYRISTMPIEIEFLLIDIFRQEIKNYRNLIITKEFMMENIDILDQIKHLLFRFGSLSSEKLKLFQKENGQQVNETQIKAFLNSIHHISRLTYASFIEAIYLMEPLKQQYQETQNSNTNKPMKISGFHRVSKSIFPFYEYPYYERRGSIFAVDSLKTPKSKRQALSIHNYQCYTEREINFEQNINFPTQFY